MIVPFENRLQDYYYFQKQYPKTVLFVNYNNKIAFISTKKLLVSLIRKATRQKNYTQEHKFIFMKHNKNIIIMKPKQFYKKFK